MIKVGVVCGDACTGGDLVRLLAQHPVVELHRIAFDEDAGWAVAEIFPGVRGRVGRRFEVLFNADQKGCDAATFAEPRGAALQQARAPVRLSSACRIALPRLQGRGQCSLRPVDGRRPHRGCARTGRQNMSVMLGIEETAGWPLPVQP